MKKFIIILLSIIVFSVYSQDFIIDNGNDYNMNKALDYYNHSSFEFVGLFSNNLIKVLLGV